MASPMRDLMIVREKCVQEILFTVARAVGIHLLRE